MESGQNQERNLKKELGLIAAMALVVGMVIGSGIFMKPGKVLLAAGDSTLALAAWALGGIITLAAGLTIAELGAQIPKTGGVYVYLEEIYGKFWSYLFGWVQTFVYGPATIGALCLYFSSLLVGFLGLDDGFKLSVGIVTILLMGTLNCLGAKYGGYVQSIATAGKLIPIVLLVVFGLFKGNGQILSMSSGTAHPSGMGAAILATLWAYDGWVGVSFVAGEMKNPAKQLPKAIIVGLGIVILAYLTVNVALFHVVSAAEIAALDKRAAGTVAGLLFGEMGGRIINIGILVSIFGALNGYILTNARVPYAMAVRGQLFASGVFGKVSTRFGTPINSTILQLTLAVGFMKLWDPDSLTDISMFIMWAFYILAFAAVFVLRKRQPPETIRPYSVPGYPIVPLIAIVGAAYIVLSMLIDKPGDACYAVGLAAIGIPVYWLLKKNYV